MKNLIFKIISLAGAIVGIFVAGYNSAKIKEQNKQLKRTFNNVKKAKNIENNTAKLSRNDKLKRL